MPSLYFHWKRWRAELQQFNHHLSTLNSVFRVQNAAFPNCLHVKSCPHYWLGCCSASDLWPLWLPQLEDRWVEHLLCELWRRLPGATCRVCIPWCLWASCGGRCCLRRLHWGPALPADLQHAEVCRVSSDWMERGEPIFVFLNLQSSRGATESLFTHQRIYVLIDCFQKSPTHLILPA